jgi:hypothetical protein
MNLIVPWECVNGGFDNVDYVLIEPRAGTGHKQKLKSLSPSLNDVNGQIRWIIDNELKPDYYDLEVFCSDTTTQYFQANIHYIGFQGYEAEGTVLNAITDNTIRGATVTLYKGTQTVHGDPIRTQVASDGTYSFGDLSPGYYWVYVTAMGGIFTDWYGYFEINSPLPYLDIYVTPPMADSEAPALEIESCTSTAPVEFRGDFVDAVSGITVLEARPSSVVNADLLVDYFEWGAPRVGFVATQLDPSEPGYLTLHCADELGNYADLPLVLFPPEVAVTPTELHAVATEGAVRAASVRVENSGGGVLMFEAETEVQEGPASPAQVAQGDYLEVPKGEDDPRPGHPAPASFGGPDAYGHIWIDSDEPDGPIFDWVDITSVGTLIPMTGDDNNTGPWPIGFDFPFYENTFSTFRICTNGFISFTSSSSAYSNQPLPNSAPGVPENLIAPWWTDLTFRYSQYYAYYHYDGTRCIIEFHEVPLRGYYGEPFYTFEIILYPNGDIVLQYLEMDDSGGQPLSCATIGIQNQSKDDGLEIVYDWPYVHSGLAILITANPPTPSWLAVAPEHGMIQPGEFVDLSVTCDAHDLFYGLYQGTIILNCNDADEPLTSIPVSFKVLGGRDVLFDEFDLSSMEIMLEGSQVRCRVGIVEEIDPDDVILESVTLTVGRDCTGPPEELNIVGPDDTGAYLLEFGFSWRDVDAIMQEGASVPVRIDGEIRGLGLFSAPNEVCNIKPALVTPAGGETLYSGQGLIAEWDKPDGTDVSHYDLYFSPDDGITWQQIASGLTSQSVMTEVPGVATTAGRFMVWAFNGGTAVGYDTSDSTVTIHDSDVASVDDDEALPTQFALRSNDPNPFSRETVVRFDLPRDVMVTMDVFDIRGRRVKSMGSHHLPAGRYSIRWDATDDSGRDVSSGVYFCRIDAGEWKATQRMVMTR